MWRFPVGFNAAGLSLSDIIVPQIGPVIRPHTCISAHKQTHTHIDTQCYQPEGIRLPYLGYISTKSPASYL